GSTVVRDGKQHIAVGVVEYEPGPGGQPGSVANPLGRSSRLAMCRTCWHTTLDPEEDDLFPGLCPQCGRVTFLTYDLREPLGYRDPYWAPDYDGTTLWSPQAGYARPTFPETLTDLPPLGNLSARGAKVELVSTNTGQDGA